MLDLTKKPDSEIISILIDELKTNSHSALVDHCYETLFNKYQKNAYHFLLMKGLKSHDAKEVAQDGFIKAFNYIHKFDLSKNFKTWFFTILLNEMRDFMTAQKKHRTKDLEDYTESYFEPEINHFEKLQNSEYYQGIINKLPDKLAEVLSLKIFSYMEPPEIAEVCKLSLKQVYNRLNEAYDLVKKILEVEHGKTY